jgi:hypothetical protein
MKINGTAAIVLVLACASMALSAGAQTKGKGKKGKEAPAAAATETAPGEEAGAAEAPEGTVPAIGAADTGAPGEGDEQKAGSYAVRLRDLEQKVNQLKEKIFRSKARLSLLAEKILAGPAGAGARAFITYTDKMGSSFKLVKAVFILDGVPVYNKVDEKGFKKPKDVQLFDSSVVPGEHTLSVSLEYKGNGYGIFAYLSDYRFKVRSSHAFSVDEGKTKKVDVFVYERGNIATPLEERPAVKYVEQAGDLGAGVGAGPASAEAKTK